MRTNIEIDDALIAEAMRVGGFKTKRAAVEAGLRMVVDKQERIRRQTEAVEGLWGGDPDWDDGRGDLSPGRNPPDRERDGAKPASHPAPAGRRRAA